MATKTKKSSTKKKSSSSSESSSSSSFRDEQRAKAAEQGQTGDNAVPEQRPQAFQEDNATHTEVHDRLEEDGYFDPMPESAHKKAASDAQLKSAEKQEKKLGNEHLIAGQRVRITGGLYEGSAGAILEVVYEDFNESQKATCGDPAVARFAQASSYLVRTRGGRHGLVSVKPDEVKPIDVLGINSSES